MQLDGNNLIYWDNKYKTNENYEVNLLGQWKWVTLFGTILKTIEL